MNHLCMICTKKHDRSRRHRLEQILQAMKQGGIQAECGNFKRPYLLWGSKAHCPYGIYCPILNEEESRCLHLTERIEWYFQPLIHAGDKNLYHNILHLLQGYFPDVYRYLENEWCRERKKAEKAEEGTT